MNLFISHDAGGANILSSLVNKKDKFYVSGPAKKIFASKLGLYKSKKKISKNFFSKNIKLVFGTSLESNHEKNILYFAIKNKISNVVWLDHWQNLKKRFEYKNQILIPDQINVINKLTCKKATKFFQGKIKIKMAKDPYYLYLKKKLKYLKKIKKKNNTLYICGLMKKIQGNKDVLNEKKCLKNFLRRFIKIQNKPSLIVRLHPGENKKEFNFLSRLDNKIKISNKIDLAQDLHWAKNIIGANSSALFYASKIYKNFVYSSLINKKRNIHKMKKNNIKNYFNKFI